MECLPLTLLIQIGDRERVNLKSNYTYRNASEVLPVRLDWVSGFFVVFFSSGCLTNGLNKCNSLWKVIFRFDIWKQSFYRCENRRNIYSLITSSTLHLFSTLTFIYYQLSHFHKTVNGFVSRTRSFDEIFNSNALNMGCSNTHKNLSM